jgi:flagellar basal-body rod protein FlgC
VILQGILKLASSALGAQSTRIRVISENIANSDSVYSDGRTPYRRKITTFEAVFDRKMAGEQVRVRRISHDPSESPRRYEPSHPRADGAGYVQYPNVQPLIEMADMRDAERSYRANVQVVETAKRLFRNALDIIRA